MTRGKPRSHLISWCVLLVIIAAFFTVSALTGYYEHNQTRVLLTCLAGVAASIYYIIDAVKKGRKYGWDTNIETVDRSEEK